MIIRKGDVVVGLKEASEHYIKTKYNTQWIVYDTENENILLGKVVPPDKYIELQNEYEDFAATHNTDLLAATGRPYQYFWVEAKHFKLVCHKIINNNEEALNLLQGAE